MSKTAVPLPNEVVPPKTDHNHDKLTPCVSDLVCNGSYVRQEIIIIEPQAYFRISKEKP